MKILISGAHGFVGGEMVAHFEKLRDEVWRLDRKWTGERAIGWNPERGVEDVEELSGFDAVIHLAGENISQGRWTAAKRKRIRESRIEATTKLVEQLLQVEKKPSVLICASAVGFYGDRGAEFLTEQSVRGEGFLSEVCVDWEAAAQRATQGGIRVVNLRFGMVLGRSGGPMAMMLPVFRMGLAGKIGDGKQYMSWVAVEDVVGATDFCLRQESLSGPVNVVSPHPSTNGIFTKMVGQMLHRPTFMALPAPLAKLFFGLMAQELLLASVRVLPEKLVKAGYCFHYSDLKEALQRIVALGIIPLT